MGLRFQKRKSIAPGVRLNLGKRGVSGLRFGGRGGGVTLGKRGITASVGLIGTGLGYVFRARRRR
jgi:hypothetical protein